MLCEAIILRSCCSEPVAAAADGGLLAEGDELHHPLLPPPPLQHGGRPILYQPLWGTPTPSEYPRCGLDTRTYCLCNVRQWLWTGKVSYIIGKTATFFWHKTFFLSTICVLFVSDCELKRSLIGKTAIFSSRKICIKCREGLCLMWSDNVNLLLLRGWKNVVGVMAGGLILR